MTFGYELKACGFNKDASIYAGINAKRNIVWSMVISGALAGIGGGIYYLSGTAQYTLVKSLLTMGFNGIPVALLGASSPIGIIFAAIFISYIQVGGEALQPEYAKEIIDIIIAVIIYLSAFSLLVKGILSRVMKGDTSNVNADEPVPITPPTGVKTGNAAGKVVGDAAGEVVKPIPADRIDHGETAKPIEASAKQPDTAAGIASESEEGGDK
jgi:simple sugar transport system permease protein